MADQFKAMVPGFRVFGGRHCQTAALRQVLAWRGLDCAESLLLGLGGGIGFIYWCSKRMPAPFVGARNAKVDEFVINAVRRLGGDAVIAGTASARKADANLKELLGRGEPAYLFADMAYLPYLAMPNDAHFGGHSIVVYGLDEAADTVWVADRGARGVTVTLDALRRARASTHPPFPAKNRLARFTWPARGFDLAPGMRAGIRESVAAMHQPPIRNFGLAGLARWADLVGGWDRAFGGAGLLAALLNVYIYIEIGGTGGQAFRPLYAEFLKLAADTLRQPDLLDAAALAGRSGEQWRRLAAAALPDWWPELGGIRELLAEKNRVFEASEADSLPRLLRLNAELEPKLAAAAAQLAGERVAKLLAGLRERILAVEAAERELFALLGRTKL